MLSQIATELLIVLALSFVAGIGFRTGTRVVDFLAR